MMLCLDCRSVFEQPKHVIDRHGLDTPPYEEYEACPHCGGVGLQTAHPCEICGQWITGSYILTSDGIRICDECYTRHDVQDD